MPIDWYLRYTWEELLVEVYLKQATLILHFARYTIDQHQKQKFQRSIELTVVHLKLEKVNRRDPSKKYSRVRVLTSMYAVC